MAAFNFLAAQAAASMAEGQHASVPIQSLLMQINGDAVCLVRPQFQQLSLRRVGFDRRGDTCGFMSADCLCSRHDMASFITRIF
jgi:hypothetical protein